MNSKHSVTVAVFAAFIVGYLPGIGAQNSIIKIIIHKVHQIEHPDQNMPGEFYAKVKLGAKEFPRTGYRVNAGTITPDWTFSLPVNKDASLPVRIQIFDKDRDRDDLLDVSPAESTKALNVVYNSATKQIHGDVVGREGSLIHARGNGDGKRIEIWFSITETKAPPPPARRADPQDISIPPPPPTRRADPQGVTIPPPPPARRADPQGVTIPPPPPARAANSQRTNCGACIVRELLNGYEQSVEIDIPCPWIQSVEPTQTYSGQWVMIYGQDFGPYVNRIGTCQEDVEKKVMLVPLQKENRGTMQEPVSLQISNWADRTIMVLIPGNIDAGRYRLGIFYPKVIGSSTTYDLVSNMVNIRINN